MSMNIKNEETHRLARELAELTGESVTEAVTIAVRERLDRLESKRWKAGLRERLLQIAHEAAPHFDPAFKSEDIADMLYDEQGLPK
jgi:antitoxin VapB